MAPDRDPADRSPWKPQELADALRVHRKTILAQIRAGEIVAVKLGHRTIRIPHDEAMRILYGEGAADAEVDPDAVGRPLAAA